LQPGEIVIRNHTALSLSLKSLSANILYEDNHVIVIDKPAGLLSQGNGIGQPDVLTEIRAMMKERDNKPGNVFLGLVHRLDRPVSGVLMLAKTSKAASRLSAAFRNRSVTKLYRAAVEGDIRQRHAETGGRLIHRLEREQATRVTRVSDSSGKEARLTFQIIGAQPHRSWIEIELETGLPHQIRAQLATIGHPIVGDRKYGARQLILNHKGVIALYCHSMSVKHPTRDELLSVAAPAPPFWPLL
jgi:23S rRNA pseudouridine1911/1915/1917 synthase